MPALRDPERAPLILTNYQCPGDILMLTAAVRDLHIAYPGRFATCLRTSAKELWMGNPFVSNIPDDSFTRIVEMRYPLIGFSNQRPLHFIRGFHLFLEESLALSVPVTRFCGDVYLNETERQPLSHLPTEGSVWLLIAGGKYDFTAKWYNPASLQKVIDNFVVQFTSCSAARASIGILNSMALSTWWDRPPSASLFG